MDYEQKYKRALERAREYLEAENFTEMADVFPELRESEDERIIREIKQFILDNIGEISVDDPEYPWLAWLEKQKEQKPVEWSEEDEKRIQRICDFLWKNRKGDTDTIYQIEKDADWLKSLRPSWKPSEEQMKALQNAVALTACDKELVRLYNHLKKLV